MNSGVSPLLLPKNQFAFGQNVSIRDGFIKNRPPYSRKTLTYSTPALKTFVESGKFQGGGFYRPDIGTESLIAQISGRLIKFTDIGSSWSVTDISIPNDPNSVTPSQVWMWQSEKWLIVQDGTGALPVFYDGVSSRRSYGSSALLGTVFGVPAPTTPPAIGASILVTLTAPYTGALNVPVIFNGEFYQASPNSSSTNVTLTNLTDTPGNTIAAGQSVVSDPTLVGITSASATVTQVPSSNISDITLTFYGAQDTSGGLLTSPSQLAGYGLFSFTGNQSYYRKSPIFSLGSVIASGTTIKKSSAQTAFNFGALNQPFIVPPIGQSVNISLSQAYTGANNSYVSINGKYYLVSGIAVVTSTTISLLNLTDVSTQAYGSGLTIRSVPEIPAGRMGAYGLGCNAVSLIDGISYIVGDIVGAGSGTPANNYRDAVLKVTQNDFLLGGGSFRIPGSGETIASMHFPPQLDTSLGQGALSIGTSYTFFSNITPGTDPAGWASLRTPIQTESLKDKGSLGQWSTVLVNSDTFFRSNDGISTLLMARRDFGTWGNKPASNEMQRILNADNQALLPYGSAMAFDNRLLHTVSPTSISTGTIWAGVITLNFDLLCSLRTDPPPSWEALWTGLNIYQVITGRINGYKRAFAFTANLTTSVMELYEFLPEQNPSYLDNDTTPITMAFETPIIFNKDVKDPTELCQLRDGEYYLSDIQGTVNVKVYFRPDFYPCWTLWSEATICQSTDATNSKSGYRMRIGLGEPSPDSCEVGNNRPLRQGYFFQLRVVITGSCTWKGIRTSAISIATPQFAPVECVTQSCQVIDCDTPDDFALYKLQG